MDIVFRTATLRDKTAIENLFIEMLRSIYQKEIVVGTKAIISTDFLSIPRTA